MPNVEYAFDPKTDCVRTPLERAAVIHENTMQEKAALSDNLRDDMCTHIENLQNELSQLEQAMLMLDDVARHKRRMLDSMMQARQGVDDVANTPHEAQGSYLQAFAHRIATQGIEAPIPPAGIAGRRT